jgi:hypothetical protein
MLKQLAIALAIVALAGACKPADRDTGAVERSGADTVVRSETVRDTTVVEADTSIDVDVDTTKKTEHAEDAKD